ncbi:docking protein 1-like isoform X1 [Hippoglossus hippoglossus]|uniref:docking protein 1-like isoform X1 n=2 Tax=Hippoglossus hippoglossus TaxID=8267 RepID=UPI00148D4141|nr:docking protein 1-like isoform X1 [Hippoglossus hippoglossus]
MDTYTKTGKVYLQPYKTGKNWKPVLLSLFASTSREVGRLEIQNMGGGGAEVDHGTAVRRHHQPLGKKKLKVVQLSKLISVVRLPSNAEACPMENMSAFCVETQDRTLVFAALKDDCVDWVKKLCHSMFQGGGRSGSNQLHLEENQIYASSDEEFWVIVQRTDAATRCGLQGFAWLQVGQEALQLRETQRKKLVREWPYELLRRYGKDKLALTIEAGRRCDSGPGTFTFETPQAEKIFFLIQSTINRKTLAITTGNQNQEGKRVITTYKQTNSPLPKIPDMTGMAIVERDLRTEEGKCGASEESIRIQGELVSQSECVSAQPAPITLMPLPLVPTNDSHSGGHQSCQSDPVYANPAECIQSVSKLQLSLALYVDPAVVLPLKPPTSRATVAPLPSSSTSHPCFDTDYPDSVYSEVYDRVGPVQSKHLIFHSKEKTKCFTDDDPIYTEPLNEKEKVFHNTENTHDPFAHLYAQVCKSSCPSTSSNTTPPCSAPSFSVSGNTSETNDMDN